MIHTDPKVAVNMYKYGPMIVHRNRPTAASYRCFRPAVLGPGPELACARARASKNAATSLYWPFVQYERRLIVRQKHCPGPLFFCRIWVLCKGMHARPLAFQLLSHWWTIKASRRFLFTFLSFSHYLSPPRTRHSSKDPCIDHLLYHFKMRNPFLIVRFVFFCESHIDIVSRSRLHRVSSSPRLLELAHPCFHIMEYSRYPLPRPPWYHQSQLVNYSQTLICFFTVSATMGILLFNSCTVFIFTALFVLRYIRR